MAISHATDSRPERRPLTVTTGVRPRDHTDSPTRMTVKRASAIRSRSSFSHSWGWYSW